MISLTLQEIARGINAELIGFGDTEVTGSV